MEDLVAIDPRTGKPTNFGPAFKAIAQFLHNREIPHVFAGTLALNACIRPRYTEEFQIICDYSALGQLGSELNRIAEQAGFCGCITAENPTHPAMTHALASRRQAVLFDTPANLPTALALCWLFLETNDLSSQVDAGALLAAGTVVSDELQSLLEQHASDAAISRFEAAKRDIEQGRYSGGYSDSVRARLERRRQKDAGAN